ncbi:MAG: hypothetical protein PUD55_01250 [Firmicutes bacterium]|nr:hypothetical protein [Bacillota bacterium]
MNEDKGFKIVGGLAVFLAVLSLLVGKFILSFLMILLAFGIFSNSKKGGYNDKNLYDKKIAKQGRSLDELFYFFENMETPLGKCWAGIYKDAPAIIYGPSAFTDIIVITDDGKNFCFRNINITNNIDFGEANAWRLDNIEDTSDMPVTQKNYSVFAALKVMSAVMTGDLAELTAGFVDGTRTNAPAQLDMYEFYRHNTKDNNLVDINDNEILKTFIRKPPLSVTLYDSEGEEFARTEATVAEYKDATDIDHDIYSDGEKFGTIKHLKGTGKNSYLIDTVNGEFRVDSFMAVRKANVASNYIITKDGERKAVVFGSPNIVFDGHGGVMQNNVICSFDDDYLVLYTLFELFVVSAAEWLR